ncbi:MAG: hypothetical protein M1829_000348 [Trizodia sp. TS-e1964]|nr:MAG: hypothetical protein M1829_000348 [Trizodia sp. TS-e1964]
MFGSQGKPDKELFLQRPSAEADTPTVGPLRIVKHDSSSQPPRSGSAASNEHNSNAPSKPTPSFPLPPGALSSANPLPYPDDRPRQESNPSVERANPLPYPENTTIVPAERIAQASLPKYPPSRKDSRDPNRFPQGVSATDVPNSLRFGDTRKASASAERRGAGSKPLPDSPGPDLPDKEGLFAKPVNRPEDEDLFAKPVQRPEQDGLFAKPVQRPTPDGRRPSQAEANPFPDYHQQYWPAPGSGPAAGTRPTQGGLIAPMPSNINRLSSTASNATTKAQRGSPPPPETPAETPSDLQFGGGIEARYAAAGISGAATLTSLQAQGAAAAQRANQYPVPLVGQPPASRQAQAQAPPRRPWTPTEQAGSQPFGPPKVYQGPGDAAETYAAETYATPTPPRNTLSNQSTPVPRTAAQIALEQDFQRMQMSSSPPPAYSTVPSSAAAAAQGFPNEKRSTDAISGIPSQTTAQSTAQAPVPNPSIAGAIPPSNPLFQQNHPAFANDPRSLTQPSIAGSDSGAPVQQFAAMPQQQAPPAIGPASPPPLPEGWIAHLDQNSGQYYYIHLPTQSTQWEFPKGHTPSAIMEPTSPTVGGYGNPLNSPVFSSYVKQPIGSPGFPPVTPGYAESIMSLSMGTPTTGTFSGPPPTSGVDVYKVAPTNGVYFGPYLRYINMDLERGTWLGSILLVTDAPQPPTIHIHQSVDLSPNPRQLKANPIFTYQRWVFYRYEIDLQMDDAASAKWTYAITSHLGCTRYEFLVAGRYETNWRFVAHSGNDFSINVNLAERSRLGGVGFLWKDIMQKHTECGGFHAQLGLGGQICADRLWKEIPLLKQWLAMSGKDNRRAAPWTAKHEEEVLHAYFHYYTSHFDQPGLREAFAQIPHVLQIDDHDIFDGYGSYPDYMQTSNMFKNIGRLGIEMYLLFQHHTTPEILRNVSTDQDLFTITGTGWHFLKYLGPAVVVIGPDCRSERNSQHVIAGPTYQGLFPKVATLPPIVQHCIWMISVPLIYPRFEAAESIAHTMATGKKAVTGAYNVLGKVTSTVAGVVGAKTIVGEGFNSVKKAVGKSGWMGNILSPFGEVDMLDELRDQWTHESKDLERTYLIRTLQGIAHQKSIRMTFLSGAVNCCGAGLVHDPAHPSDHKTMYQIISSAIVNVSPSNYILKMLHNNKALYVPQNGHRSSINVQSDTKEDMMEIFQLDVTGTPRELKRLMGRRNYVAIVAYDPEAMVAQTPGYADAGGNIPKLSLAFDFMVQGDGAYSAPTKYGPVIVPSLEFGR